MLIKDFVGFRRQYLFLIIFGFIARIVVSIKGNNFDFESYRIVALAIQNGITPWETYRYNYGIAWAVIIFILDLLSFHSTLFFRILLILTLTIADLYISSVIAKQFNYKFGLLFFLNPISIMITGYYNQFDNLAIAVGLMAIINLSRFKRNSKHLLTIFLLTLSLMIKHDLLFFLPWIFFSKELSSIKFKITTIPLTLYILHFLPFMAMGSDVYRAIYSNVFMYWSANNAPFWQFWFRDKDLVKYLSDNAQWHHGRIWMILFFLSVTAVGILNRKNSILNNFFLYSICFVLFSSAITTQFYAIGAIGAAAFFNLFFVFYFLFGALWILADPSGLGLESVQKLFIKINLHGWNSLPIFLLPGLIWMGITRIRLKIVKPNFRDK
jgi:hypothetical protein